MKLKALILITLAALALSACSGKRQPMGNSKGDQPPPSPCACAPIPLPHEDITWRG